MTRSTLLTLILFFFVTSLLAQAPVLKLKAGDILPPSYEQSFLRAQDIMAWPQLGDSRIGVLQFSEIPTKAERNELRLMGVELLDYLPERAFLAKISTSFSSLNVSETKLIAAIPFEADLKVDAQLKSGNIPSRVRAGRNSILVNVHYFDFVDAGALTTALGRKYKIVLEEPQERYVTVEVKDSEVQTLASMPEVKLIDAIYEPGEPENYTGRTLHRSNYISSDNANGLNYDGQGVVVMLQDDGLIGPHIDYQGRLLDQFWSVNLGDHGDHVAGIIMGAGNLDPTVRGNAWGADIYQYKAAPEYQGFDSIPIHYASKGINITSTSYSNGCNAGYTSLTRTMDQQINDYPTLMHVFSAGNAGTNNCGYGAGAGWGNITGGHKAGKNVIAVGNLDENGVLTGSSSVGPAHDGRIKPEVCAKGVAVVSTIDPNTYGTKTGTSMSCPGVSGTLAQLYNAYEDIHGQLPAGGLMKAILMNTCDDIGNPGPDFRHGFGQINAKSAYEVINGSQFLLDSADANDSNVHVITVPAGVGQLKIMLYWNDPEASVNASTALVNDLDMVVETPSLNLHLPWVLDHTPNASNLNAPATQGVDHINNVEQVTIMSPEAGSYNISVNAFQLPAGIQRYWIVYEIEMPEVALTYPIGGESFVPGSTEKIRWDAVADSNSFTLEYSDDSGVSWSQVATNLNGSNRFYNWQVPATVNGNIRMRISDAFSSSESVADISIIGTPSNLNFTYACPDSIELTWSGVTGATGYTVFRLGAVYMDSIGFTTGNVFTDLGTNPNAEYWYSVRAHGPDGAVGKRAEAVQKTPGVFNCILPFDLAIETVHPGNTTLLNCQSDSITVGADIYNYGQVPITTFDATYTVNGANPVSETFNVTIPPNSADNFSFSSKIGGLSSSSTVEVTVDYTNDVNVYNDTGSFELDLANSTIVSPIWKEDFESFTLCSTEAFCELIECQTTNGWINERNVLIDDIDWRANSGSTPSNSTGPFQDYNPGNFSGKYLYLEASGDDCTFREGRLISPCIDLTDGNSPSMVFYYHMFGATMGSLHIDVFDGEQWVIDAALPITGNQGNAWTEKVVDLSAFLGKVINIRFRGITGSDFRSDIAIDDISIIELPLADFEYEVLAPPSSFQVAFTDQSKYADTMSFDLGDGTISDSVVAFHTYGSNALVIVTQWVANAYGEDSTSQVIAALSASSAMGEPNFIAFPNPTRGLIELHGNMSRVTSIFVQDIAGRVVLEPTFSADSKVLRLDLTGLSTGSYFITLLGPEVNERLKISLTQ